MPIDIQEIISRMTEQVEKTAEGEVVVTPEAPGVQATTPVAAAVATPAVAIPPVVTEEVQEQQKVAAEMDEAGRVIARAFYDELQKIAVSAHGYVDTLAEEPTNPAVQMSLKPSRLNNAMRAAGIIDQLTAGERLHGTEGYIEVNGNIVEPTAPELTVDEHPLLVDAGKRADAAVISKIYTNLFGA